VVRLDLIREKVRRLREDADLLRRRLPADAAALAADRDALDLVSFRVYLALQEAVDISSHLIADEGWGPAPSLRDHFEILAAHAVLDASLASSLADGVRIRNLIGHAYARVDPVRLLEAARALLPLVEAFSKAVLTYAEGRGGE
jgi:uncharacterized protein YutE (UPF0331/DUF86 family)